MIRSVWNQTFQASAMGRKQHFKPIEFKIASRHVPPNSSIGAVRLSTPYQASLRIAEPP
jgi:hypothetical protein